jgi:ABC-type polysaccharide/polyol phosphate export permease
MQINFSAIDGPRMAAWDFVQGLLSWRLWAFLGLQDIRQRYRRSSFGPLWLTLGLGVTILGIGILYARILKVTTGDFIPFLAVSLLVWNFISTVVNESVSLFLVGAGLMTSTRIPYTSFVLRGLVRNLIVAAHCTIPVAIAFFYYKHPVGWIAFAAIPGLLLLLLNLYWISLCIGIICLRFRDMGQIVIYGTQLALFVTPIIWMPTQISPDSPILKYNPINHLINLVRGPLFYGVFPVESYAVALLMLLVGGVCSAAVMVYFRRYLVFWL